MMKKILGGTVVASALLLASCGYTPEEQKFYDACVKVGEASQAKFDKIKNSFDGRGDTPKSFCADVITEENNAKGANAEKLKGIFKEYLEKLKEI